MQLQFDALNAAGAVSQAGPQTLQVDNVGPSVNPSPTNDPDPQHVWVNHPVTVTAHPSAGPSGVQSVSCADGSRTTKASSITIDGTGVHTVACSATDNTWSADEAAAGGAQGHGATATRSLTVKIDETPPSLMFQPQNPAFPTDLIVDTSDGQSGVASGSVQMRPAGGTWTSIPAQFDGQHLIAHINDAGLSGAYEFQATGCDVAGNCAATSETLMLPLRLGSVSNVSFQRIVNPLKPHWVLQRVRVGWHWTTVKRHGALIRVKRGGHYRTIRVLRWRAQCKREVAKASNGRWHVKTVCRLPHVVTFTSKRVRFGRRATLHGTLTTSQGVPIPGGVVRILTAPDNGLDQLTQATTIITGPDGSWSVKLPAGPSRIIQAAYDGSPTVEPSTGQANIHVGASIRLIKVKPTAVPWGGTVRFRAKLRGGYLPSGGALVRLRIGYGNAVTTYGVKEHVAGTGAFFTTYTFGLGSPSTVLDYWFQECTLPMGDYPYTPACSRKVTVRVGG